MESLRRLECEFSVVKFGQQQSLVKKLNDPLTDKQGEMILESFSFDEGTDLQPAMAFALQHGFTRSGPAVQDATVHRCVMVMTDGFVVTSEDARRAYQSILKSARSPSGEAPVICMLGLVSETTRSMKDSLWAGLHFLTGVPVRPVA